MDITGASTQRLELGVEQFKDGGSLSYHNVVFCWRRAIPRSELNIHSFSDWHDLEEIKPAEAEEKILRAKEVAQELAARSSAFKELWQSAEKRFQFCFDTDNGGFMLAEEVDARIVWHVKACLDPRRIPSVSLSRTLGAG